MKNRTHLFNLMLANTGHTTIQAPVIRESVNDLVQYWPSWAKDVRRNER